MEDVKSIELPSKFGEDVERFLCHSIDFLGEHEQLVNGPVVDYLSENLYDKLLPEDIRTWWDSLENWDQVLKDITRCKKRVSAVSFISVMSLTYSERINKEDYPQSLKELLSDFQDSDVSRSPPQFCNNHLFINF